MRSDEAQAWNGLGGRARSAAARGDLHVVRGPAGHRADIGYGEVAWNIGRVVCCDRSGVVDRSVGVSGRSARGHHAAVRRRRNAWLAWVAGARRPRPVADPASTGAGGAVSEPQRLRSAGADAAGGPDPGSAERRRRARRQTGRGSRGQRHLGPKSAGSSTTYARCRALNTLAGPLASLGAAICWGAIVAPFTFWPSPGFPTPSAVPFHRVRVVGGPPASLAASGRRGSARPPLAVDLPPPRRSQDTIATPFEVHVDDPVLTPGPVPVADRTELLPGWELEVQDFTSKVVDTRNWLVHWGDPWRPCPGGRRPRHARRAPLRRARHQYPARPRSR
jgi:hypothetical protein